MIGQKMPADDITPLQSSGGALGFGAYLHKFGAYLHKEVRVSHG